MDSNKKIQMSLFKLYNDNVVHDSRVDTTWKDVVDDFKVDPIVSTDYKDGKAYSFWIFDEDKSKNGVRLCYENALRIGAIVLDYDNGDVSIEDFRTTYHNLEYILHTTHFHTDKLNKFRVIIPLTKPCKRDRVKGYRPTLKNMFKCNGRSYITHVMFFPTIKDKDSPYEFYHNEGDTIDVRRLVNTNDGKSKNAARKVSSKKVKRNNSKSKNTVQKVSSKKVKRNNQQSHDTKKSKRVHPPKKHTVKPNNSKNSGKITKVIDKKGGITEITRCSQKKKTRYTPPKRKPDQKEQVEIKPKTEPSIKRKAEISEYMKEKKREAKIKRTIKVKEREARIKKRSIAKKKRRESALRAAARDRIVNRDRFLSELRAKDERSSNSHSTGKIIF